MHLAQFNIAPIRFPHDDPRMLAMEAYIYAQRQGTPLQFGKQ